jgi:nucleoside-diphosphate-sugar epimerase
MVTTILQLGLILIIEASMNKLTVFGGNGFIGGRLCEMHPDRVVKVAREDYKPKTNQLVYFISTIDNYNIHKDLYIDINTNLNTLMTVLDNIDKDDKETTINFISSWFVYGKNVIMPFNEELSTCNPTGFYSITKRCAEQMLISFCETFGLKYRIFRLANVLGEQDSKISKKKNALQHLIKQSVLGEDLELYNGGNAIRDYIYVDDACNAIIHCIDNAPENEIINIGNGKPHILSNIINKSMLKTKSNSTIVQVKPPHFHDVVQVEHSYLDISKLKSYGFESRYSIDDIIEKLTHYYKNKI